jgi:hypothetical protein
LRIGALSPGWRGSFEALLNSQTARAGTGNVGLMPAAAAHPASPGFQRLAVTAIDQESADVLSFTIQSTDGHQLPTAMPGQYVVVRLQRPGDRTVLYRSYSLSGPPSSDHYRISVKIEPNGAAGNYLREHIDIGQALDVSSPRGSFVLGSDEWPVVLLSAGENFTVEGLADDVVCIGDRYQIGSALFEVTQPRVTCYRVGHHRGRSSPLDRLPPDSTG